MCRVVTRHVQGSDASCPCLSSVWPSDYTHYGHPTILTKAIRLYSLWPSDYTRDTGARIGKRVVPLLTLHGAHRMLCRTPRAVAHTMTLWDGRGGVQEAP